MTDKQIIIDGVPVQDCCYFDYENDSYEDSCYIHQNECSAQNCYYKQLKRKEQECEELKKDVIEALKLVEITSTHNTFQESRINKLSKTLTEIKEVLQFYNNTTIGVDKGNGVFELEVFNDNVGKLIYCYDTNPAKEALQKISECEVENA